MSQVRISFIEAGFTTHLEAISMRGGRLKAIRFPATVAVIEHPREGVILFDTGYSARFFAQTKYFPERFYSLVTPVHIAPEHTALQRLRVRGISVRDVRHVVLSHFHADHVGGVADFPYARYIYRGSAYAAVRDLGTWASVKAGFLRGLLPPDFVRRGRELQDQDFRVGDFGFHDFDVACDLFGDGQILAVDLPGHAEGQIGLLVHAENANYFLVADACWGERAYRDFRPPSALVRPIFADWSRYKSTLGKIRGLAQREGALKIVPCHCEKTLADLSRVVGEESHGPHDHAGV